MTLNEKQRKRMQTHVDNGERWLANNKHFEGTKEYEAKKAKIEEYKRQLAPENTEPLDLAKGYEIQESIANPPNRQPATTATPTAPVTTKPSTGGRTNLTADDMIRETGGDYDEMVKWLKARPGYNANGPRTQAALAEAKARKEAKAKTEEEPKPEEQLETAKVSEMDDGLANASKKSVEDIIGSDNEQKKQVKKAAQSIWEAIASGDMDLQTGGYFLMDAIQKAANNRQRRDSNYIENLSRAANGDTILSYDIGNDEKSKYETMVQNPALERANGAADIESQSNAQTAADLSTAQAEQQYGEQVGPQGLGQTAATVSAMGGNFDEMANAVASGDKDKVEAMLNAQLEDPVTKHQMNELQKKLQESTLDSEVLASKIMNQLSQAQVSMLQAQTKLLGYQGSLQECMVSFLNAMRSSPLGDAGTGALMMGSGFLGDILKSILKL